MQIFTHWKNHFGIFLDEIERLYELANNLEIGVENISAGLHVASPDSLTLW